MDTYNGNKNNIIINDNINNNIIEPEPKKDEENIILKYKDILNLSKFTFLNEYKIENFNKDKFFEEKKNNKSIEYQNNFFQLSNNNNIKNNCYELNTLYENDQLENQDYHIYI